jgi:hypothetical protein
VCSHDPGVFLVVASSHQFSIPSHCGIRRRSQIDDDCKSSREPIFTFQALRVMHQAGNMATFLVRSDFESQT